MTLRSALSILILLLLGFPFLILLTHSTNVQFPLNDQVAKVFLLTVLQAACSALTALCCGIPAGLGLLWASGRSRWAGWLQGLAVFPNAVPVLLLLLAVTKIFPWARGLPGIVLVHALLNVGLVAVAFQQLVQRKISGMAELAYVEGASGWRLFWRGVLPVLRADLILLFLFIFAVCFTSFAVPLMLGGSRATTVEVLIYQKIRISGEWSEALGLALMQMLAIVGLTWVLRGRTVSAASVARPVVSKLLQWAPGVSFILAPAVILLVGLLSGISSGVEQLRALPELLVELPALFAGSLIVGMLSGISILLLLALLSFVRPEGKFAGLLAGYAAPSSALVGFALLILWREPGISSLFKISLGFSLVVLPAFYRYQWSALLASLSGQVAVAKTLGASDGLIFWRVIFPQVAPAACRLAGLAALWAWGDFALSSVIAERSLTLAMAAQGLMSSYRLDAATLLIWMLIGGGLLTYFVFYSMGQGVGNVLGSESET